MNDNELFELCKEVYAVLPEWSNNASNPRALRVWMPYYSISEMGKGNDDYESTPIEERNTVNIDDEWRIVDDPKHQITTGQEVFKWWYSKVREIELNTVPAYNSDYLLEKLPNGVTVSNANGKWGAWVVTKEETLLEDNTPLKALLKLTLALAEAGELK